MPDKADKSATLPEVADLQAGMAERGTLSLLDGAAFERALRMAELMSTANGLPGFYGRSPGTCMAAIEEGIRLGISPFVVARMSYQVKSGPLAYLGKFVVALINTHPAIQGRLSFEHVGAWERVQGKFNMVESQRVKDEHGNPTKYAKGAWKEADEEDLAVLVRGTLADTGEVAELKLTMHQCWPRNSTLWATDPQHQICYVAARRWADRFVPEVLMGMSTDAELGEMIDITNGQQEPPPPRSRSAWRNGSTNTPIRRPPKLYPRRPKGP